MNLLLGSQMFVDVQIPLLWGTRAVVGHPTGELSIINLQGDIARPEVVKNEPWTGVEWTDMEDGFAVYEGLTQRYFFSPARKILRDLKGRLLECEIRRDATRIGSSTISNSMVRGFGVGIGVEEDGGFFLGGPMPAGLAKLSV